MPDGFTSFREKVCRCVSDCSNSHVVGVVECRTALKGMPLSVALLLNVRC